LTIFFFSNNFTAKYSAGALSTTMQGKNLNIRLLHLCKPTISHSGTFILHMTKLVHVVRFLPSNYWHQQLWLPERVQTNVNRKVPQTLHDRCSLTRHTNNKYKNIYNEPQLMTTEAMLPLPSKPGILWLKCYLKKPLG